MIRVHLARFKRSVAHVLSYIKVAEFVFTLFECVYTSLKIEMRFDDFVILYFFFLQFVCVFTFSKLIRKSNQFQEIVLQ